MNKKISYKPVWCFISLIQRYLHGKPFDAISKKHLLLAIACFVFFQLIFQSKLYAVPAYDGLFELKQPSGIFFEARLRGDEWYNWVETKDGYGIYKNTVTDNWEYYVPSSDTEGVRLGLTQDASLPDASRVIVREADPSLLGIPRGLRPHRKKSPIDIDLIKKYERASISGKIPLLVICVEYADELHKYPVEDIQPLFFGDSNSVSDYYSKVSYSTVTITPAEEKHGTANDGIIGWLQLSGNHPNTGTNTGNANKKIAKKAIRAAKSNIDFASYDINKNDILEPTELSIIIIVAGYEASNSGTAVPSVWGHRGSLKVKVDGVKIKQYAQFGEKMKENNQVHIATIGIMCHELGHLTFSLPDLYDTTPEKGGDSLGVGYFDLMGAGNWGAASGKIAGSSPTQLSAWSKEYLSWGAVNTISSSQTISLPKVDGNNSAIFRINTSDSNQYFLIENREFSGYDVGFLRHTGESGHGGLVIYHIDKLKTDLWPGTNTVNAEKGDKGVDVEEANEGSLGHSMLDTYEKGADTNMFFFQGNNTDFMDTTTPSSKLKKDISTNISITDISTYSDTMTAMVTIPVTGNTTPTPSTTVTPSPTPTPTVTSFKINNDATSTTNRTVTLNNTATGNPTQYMASESSSFSTASWQTYSTAPSFTLSSGNGSKTVYFKIRNSTNAESSVVSDSITLNESTTTTSITVTSPNGGETWQAGSTKTISWNYTGSPGSYVKVELLKRVV